MLGFSWREIWTIVHGTGFGFGLLLLLPLVIAGSVLLGRDLIDRRRPFFRVLIIAAWLATVLAWLTVLAGTYLPYPWYHAHPPTHAGLAHFPRAYLLAHRHLAIWANLGMRWKEYLGWAVPFLCTAATYNLGVYGERFSYWPQLRKTVAALFALSFATALIAGLLGIFITKLAPVR